MSKLDDKLLSFAPGAKVELFDLDLSSLGGSVLHWTPSREEMTPNVVLRLMDNATGSQSRLVYDLSGLVEEDETLIYEAYIRSTADTDRPAIGFSGSTQYWGNPNTVAVIDPTDLSISYQNNGTVFTSHSAVASNAGEFIYMSGVVETVGNATPYVIIEPQGTSSELTGEIHIAYFKLYRMVGSTRVPVLGPNTLHGGDWYSHASLEFEDNYPNTAQLLKVPVFNSNAYTPIPVKAEGFEKDGTGTFPRPKITVSNLFGEASALNQAYNNLSGATVTRRVVFADFLDNGSDPDPLAVAPPDIYTVDRKALSNGTITTYELSSALDQSGVMLPGRQVLRDTCPWVYRTWDEGAGAFDYSRATCPYVGGPMFDVNGDAVVDEGDDKCSRKLATGCRMRYPKNVDSPFGGFPMVGRLG